MRTASAPAFRYSSPRFRGLLETVTGDERLDAGDDDEVLVPLGFFHRAKLARMLVHVGERLRGAADEAVRLREELVLDADAGNAALLELGDEAPRRVEVAVARVAIEEDRDGRGVRHELDDFHHLGPAGFVVVADAERGRDRQTAAPDPLEARFFGDLRGEPVVGLHQEGEAVALEHGLECGRLLRNWLNHLMTIRAKPKPGVNDAPGRATTASTAEWRPRNT